MISIEVVIRSVEDALLAEEAGVNRLELVSAFEVGGLTPSLGVVRAVRRAVQLPIRVMVRPSAGWFVYSEPQILAMLTDIQLMADEGIDGFVFGCITEDGKIDQFANERLIASAHGLPCTFHRASDVTTEPYFGLQSIMGIGFQSILSSGGTGNAMESLKVLQDLVSMAGNRIEVMVCGGVRAHNVTEIVQTTGCQWVHLGPFLPPTFTKSESPLSDFLKIPGSLNTEELRKIR